MMMMRRPAQAAPPWADAVAQLAWFATGDRDYAMRLARVALHRAAGPGAAVAALQRRLPASWLSWPSVGPREFLTLRLRAHEAERLVSDLGSWAPEERLLLGATHHPRHSGRRHRPLAGPRRRR